MELLGVGGQQRKAGGGAQAVDMAGSGGERSGDVEALRGGYSSRVEGGADAGGGGAGRGGSVFAVCESCFG